jgi:tripartite motif-containing protein 71
MKRVLISALTAFATATASAEWVYEGEWGRWGRGNGEFDGPCGIAVSHRSGNVYVADGGNNRVQWFTSTGSFLGKWGSLGSGDGEFWLLNGVAVAPNGSVYAVDGDNGRTQYFTPTGSFLGKWGDCGNAIAIGPNGYVYQTYGLTVDCVKYFTPTGSLLGWWGAPGTGKGFFQRPHGVGVAGDGRVYVADTYNHRIQYFTSVGSYLGQWGKRGTGDGEFDIPWALDVAPDGKVFVLEYRNPRVQYFTANGSFLGKWGSYGHGEGQFYRPLGIALSRTGARAYVAEVNLTFDRVQYFNRNKPAVAPTSLGCLRALYR